MEESTRHHPQQSFNTSHSTNQETTNHTSQRKLPNYEASQLSVIGDNSQGQLGLMKDLFLKVPKTISFGICVSQVACGLEHTLLLTLPQKSVYAMGSNRYGQLGLDMKVTENCQSPQLITTLSNEDIREITCGPAQSFAISQKSGLYVWGLNDNGQLGPFTAQVINSPQKLTSVVGVKLLDSSRHMTCIVTNENTVFIYRLNTKFAPMQIVDINISQVTCLAQDVYILTKEGSMYQLIIEEQNLIRVESPCLIKKLVAKNESMIGLTETGQLITNVLSDTPIIVKNGTPLRDIYMGYDGAIMALDVNNILLVYDSQKNSLQALSQSNKPVNQVACGNRFMIALRMQKPDKDMLTSHISVRSPYQATKTPNPIRPEQSSMMKHSAKSHSKRRSHKPNHHHHHTSQKNTRSQSCLVRPFTVDSNLSSSQNNNADTMRIHELTTNTRSHSNNKAPLESELKIMQRQFKSVKSQANELLTAYRDQCKRGELLESQVNELQDQNTSLKKKLDKKRTQVRQLATENNLLKETTQLLQQKIQGGEAPSKQEQLMIEQQRYSENLQRIIELKDQTLATEREYFNSQIEDMQNEMMKMREHYEHQIRQLRDDQKRGDNLNSTTSVEKQSFMRTQNITGTSYEANTWRI